MSKQPLSERWAERERAAARAEKCPDCGRPVGNGLFDETCRKLLRGGDDWALDCALVTIAKLRADIGSAQKANEAASLRAKRDGAMEALAKVEAVLLGLADDLDDDASYALGKVRADYVVTDTKEPT